MVDKTQAADELETAVAPRVGPAAWYERQEYAAVLPELEEIKQRYHDGKYSDKSDVFIFRWCKQRFGLRIERWAFLGWLNK